MGKSSDYILARLRSKGFVPDQSEGRFNHWCEYIMPYRLSVCGDEEKLARIVDTRLVPVVRGRRFRISAKRKCAGIRRGWKRRMHFEVRVMFESARGTNSVPSTCPAIVPDVSAVPVA